MGRSGQFKYTWEINNFSRLKKRLYSEVFIVASCKWRILLFPKGKNVDYLSIYLEVADSTSLPNGWNRDAYFSLAVINKFSSKSTVRREAQHFFNSGELDLSGFTGSGARGFPQFMPLSKLKDPSERFLVNNTLTIEAGVHVRRAKYHSLPKYDSAFESERDVNDEPKLPKAPEKQDSLPQKDDKAELELPNQVVETPKEQVLSPQIDTEAKAVPPSKEEVQAVLPITVQETLKESQTPPAILGGKVPRKSPSFDTIGSSLNLQTMSKNLLTEISSRKRPRKFVDSNKFAGQDLRPEFVQQQKEALQGFFNMSLEDVQQANAFDDIEGIIVSLLEDANTLQEKIILEDFVSHFAEFKESILDFSTEIIDARRTALAGKTTDVNERLEKRQKELSSMEAKFSRIEEEEAKVEAQIQLLMAKKEELVSQKNSAAIELEKANQEASKDLEEWRSLEREVKQANTDWRERKEKLALAIVRWELFKEELSHWKT